MSDTDEDLVPNSFHKFPHDKTAIHTQSSDIHKTTYGSYTNMMSSHFNMPNQFMGFDQRSMYSRRATSPMSVHSFSNSRMRLQQSYSQRAMSSRGSVYNARCRSPMSVRSIDSNASVSAADIALAFKNMKYSKYELRVIQEAYNNHIRGRTRKRIGKRRNLKSFIKHCTRKSGGESGAEGSDSSVSSDDCRSTRSAFYIDNRARNRLPKIDFTKFKRQERENEIYKDCTENFKHNYFKNQLSGNSRPVNNSIMPLHNQQIVQYDHIYKEVTGSPKEQCSELQNAPIVTLKDRLEKDSSSLLPFQRFNKSAGNPSYEISFTEKNKTVQQKEVTKNKQSDETESDDIFPQTQIQRRHNLTRSLNGLKKTILETENSYPEGKRRKLSTSPTKQNNSPSIKITKNMKKNDEFKFKKPQLPIKKIGPFNKDNEPEILIAKSSQPLVGNLEPISMKWKDMPQTVINLGEDVSSQTKQSSPNHNDTINSKTIAEITQNSSDVSMKPSFLKRKLFTQRLDIVENKNISSDHLNSPQTKVLRACREKNKVRKLTSQSCLSRDVPTDNNYLDLIHKIVPPDEIKNQNLNNTNVANKRQGSKRSLEQESKWDVTLAVSTCNDDDKSATYTDEEIFNDPQQKTQINKASDKGTKGETQEKKSLVTLNCKVIAQKLPDTFDAKDYIAVSRDKQCQDKRTVINCVKSFWDTDFESDMEDRTSFTSERTFQKDKIPKDSHNLTNDVIAPKMKPRGTILSIRNSRNLGSLNSQVRSKKIDSVEANKENNIDINTQKKSTRSCSNNKSEIKIIGDKSDKAKDNLNSKSNNQKNNKQRNPKPQTPSSKEKEESQSIFNISRESLRKKLKRNSPPAMEGNHNVKSSNSCNTSRESLRLRIKREAKLNCKENVCTNLKKKRVNLK